MALNDRIVAWLQIRNRARFSYEARRAAEDIKRISRAANDGEGPLNQLGGALSSFADQLPQVTGRSRIFGFAIGTVVTAFVAVIPLVVGLGGALVALAGSFGAAALGAGALATAVLGAALPLGALGLVAAGFLQSFMKVNTAFQRYQIAVKAFGRESQQAETALARLNATAEVMGGRGLVMLVKRWNDVVDSFRKANRPAVTVIIGILGDLLKHVQDLMPAFAHMATIAATLVRSGLQQFFQDMADAGVGQMFDRMIGGFETLAGPLMTTVTNFLIGLLTLAARTAPLLGRLGDGIVGVSEAFRNWTETVDIGGLVSQFWDWMDLLTAIGRLFVTIFSAGASDGQSMVQSLTDVINRWSDFLSTTEGQDSLKKFFGDAIKMTEQFSAITAAVTAFLFKFGSSALDIYTTVMQGLRDGANTVSDAFSTWGPTWDNVLKPMIEGLAGGIIGGVIGAFKLLMFFVKATGAVFGLLTKHLGFLNPVFKALGWVIGFIFGGEILDALSLIGKLNILLRPLGFFFKALGVPIKLAGGALGFFATKIGQLIGWGARFVARFIGPIRGAIDSILGFLTGVGARFYNVGVRLFRSLWRGFKNAIASGLGFAGDIGKAVYNWIASRFNHFLPNKIGPKGVINLPDNPLPLLASGGIVSGAGSWITGEAGPELNTLTSGGSVVVKPLTAGFAPTGQRSSIDPGGGRRVLVSKVYLKGRQIAEAVADEAEDDQTRRGR